MLHRGCPLPPVTVETLRAQPNVGAAVVNLECSLAQIQEQRSSASSLGEYFALREQYPLLYCQEVYARDLAPLEREYPAREWEHKNLFLSGCAHGRCESFFLGNAGTYGPVHSDEPLGVALILVISGCKRVVLFPPGEESQARLETNLGAVFNGSVSDVAFPGELDEELVRECGGRVEYLRSGDLLVIPRGTFHQILNIEDDTLSWHDMILQVQDIASYQLQDAAGALPEIEAAIRALPEEERSVAQKLALTELAKL